MALVPFEMVGRISGNNLSALKTPNETQVSKNMDEMTNVSADETLTGNQKMNRFNEELNDYTVFANKVVNTQPIAHQPPSKQQQQQEKEDMFRALPKTLQNNANAFMKEMEKHPNIIQWNAVNSEVSVEGKTLNGSNIVDLIGHVMRSRKTVKAPVHGDAFLKILTNLNVPEEFVKNKYQIPKFRSYKHNVDDDDDDLDNNNIDDDDGEDEI